MGQGMADGLKEERQGKVLEIELLVAARRYQK